jgi:hypothetical protein
VRQIRRRVNILFVAEFLKEHHAVQELTSAAAKQGGLAMPRRSPLYNK